MCYLRRRLRLRSFAASWLLNFFFIIIRRPPRSTLFPTRRSSDLRFKGVEAADILARSRATALVTVTDAVADRKSTRLNSSHEWISYAVFCLKKKMICMFPAIELLLTFVMSLFLFLRR